MSLLNKSITKLEKNKFFKMNSFLPFNELLLIYKFTTKNVANMMCPYGKHGSDFLLYFVCLHDISSL